MATPSLAPLPEFRVKTVVVGTSVRKRVDVLRAYLNALAWQELPPGIVLKPLFVPDDMSRAALELLTAWTKARGGELLRGVPAGGVDWSDDHPDTHQWSPSAMARVGANKDRILKRARELNADYVWFCDADLICDRTTLASMLAVDTPIVSAVYWTRWSKSGAETRKVHAAPQVWLTHPYGLAGRGFEEHEFRDRLARRQIVKVPGYGACTLIARRAIEAGVSFAPVADVPQVGLMAGEDRQFCIRAERMHLESVADAWPDIFHVYHLKDDVPQIPAMVARLGTPHAASPALGDLVQLTLAPLEPVPHATGWTMVRPQSIRGRLGALALAPEIEEAVYGLTRGADVVVPVHFPVHHEVAYYRGRRRLVRVTLVDCKPAGFAPVLEDEMLVGTRSRASVRQADFTSEQLDGMKEVAGG